jgi:diacylglycerol kinase
MKGHKNIYRKTLLHSFADALCGVLFTLRSERNFQIQSYITLAVVVMGFIVNISAVQWIFLIMAIGMVCVTELINTALEKLCNRISMAYDEEIRLVKDISAGAVLVSSIVALAIGCAIFLPILIQYLHSWWMN